MAVYGMTEKPLLADEQAIEKRDELVELGYTVIPGVLDQEFLEELRLWSDGVFEQRAVDPRFRYQGSDIHVVTPRHWKTLEDQSETDKRFSHPIVERILDYPLQRELCRQLQLENLESSESVILLSKPAYGPPLYWHQDCMFWNSPRAATPWPTRIFLSYYLVDTHRDNGCLKVIPGTHRQWIDLHDILPNAHEPEIQAIDDLSHDVFMDRSDAVDVPLKAGDLVIADCRLLHSAGPNLTDQRRTLTLAWHDCLSFPEPPSWWTGDVPEVVKNADPSATYETTRMPSEYLGAV